MLSKQECIDLFKGYIINVEDYPFRIDLPRALVAHTLGYYTNHIDMEWYEKEEYKDHRYSLFNIESKKDVYIKKYNEWRNSFRYDKNHLNEMQGNFTNFNELLNYASNNQRSVVIGESHDNFAAKSILMHNIKFLKEKNAIIFMENIFSELQDELNKSIKAKEPTPLIKAFLIYFEGVKSDSYYNNNNLIMTCIQEGIPVIACDNFFTQICGQECKVVDGHQTGTISRMTVNYECQNGINYAKENFPNNTFNIFLVGDAHACTYIAEKNENDVHPGVVDITSGMYVNAQNTIVQQGHKKVSKILISKEDFFKILKGFGELTEKAEQYLNYHCFNGGDVTTVNELQYYIVRMELPYGQRPHTGLGNYISTATASYIKYIQMNPSQRFENSRIENYSSTVDSGYQIIVQDESEIIEMEGTDVVQINTPLPTKPEFEYVILPNNLVQYIVVITDEIKNFILNGNIKPVDQINFESNQKVVSENKRINLCNSLLDYQSDYLPTKASTGKIVISHSSIFKPACNTQVATSFKKLNDDTCDFAIIDNNIEKLQKFLESEIKNINLRNNGAKSIMAEQLQYVLTWLQTSAFITIQQEIYVFDLVHSICSINSTYFSLKLDSKTAFKNQFPEKDLSNTILTAQELMLLENINDIPLLLEQIESKINYHPKNNCIQQ